MRIKVLNFNIHKGFGYFNKNYNIDTIRELLETWNPDIILLQELHGLHPKSHPDSSSPLEKLADSHWPFHKHGVNSIYEKNFHGNAIISRFPIVDWKNTDISTNSLEKRGLINSLVELPNNITIQVICTHLNLFPTGQIKQAKEISKVLHTHSRKPTLLGGDFNDWSGQVAKYFSKNSVLTKSSNQKNYPSILPLLKMDNIYYKDLKKIDSRLIKDFRFCSDHLALLVTFEV